MFIIYIRYVFAQIWKNIYHFKKIFMARNRRLEISTVILCGETRISPLSLLTRHHLTSAAILDFM